MFYNNLKEVKKIVHYCKKIEIDHQNEDAFFNFFIQIDNFIREYEYGASAAIPPTSVIIPSPFRVFFPDELLFTYRTFFIPQTGQVQ